MIIAQTMLERTEMDEIWFVVSPQNPLKQTKSLLHEFDRYDMVQAAVNENPKFRVTDIEFGMPKPSYTIDTLAFLSERYSKHSFKLIIGEDNLKSFQKWKNYQVILEDYGLLVYPRPNTGESDSLSHDNIEFVKAPLLDISATFIRESVKKRWSIHYLVPDPVESLIHGKGFYL